MEKEILYFDLETQRSANDVGGWGNKDKMGMSIGVTFSTKTGQYHIFGESDADALIEQLMKADKIIGFNHVGFDLPVLQKYTILDLPAQTINLDLLLDLEQRLGHRLKLDAVASATLGFGKTADGLEAIKWWREGKILQIAEYCAYDVKVTKEVHEFGVQHGFVKYKDRFGNDQQVEVNWAV